MTTSADWSYFSKIIEAAMRVKRDLAEEEKSSREKKSSFMFSGEEERKSVEGSSKQAMSSFSQGSRWTGHQKPRFTECGKRHSGVCEQNSIACFKCGQVGHFQKEWHLTLFKSLREEVQC